MPKVSIPLISIFVVAALLAPVLAPHDPLTQSLVDSNTPPAWLPGGNGEYILGADRLGRDILSRLLFGSRVSLAVVAISILIAGTTGSGLGLIAGFYGGVVDSLVMRAVDLLLALPVVLLAFVLAVIAGPSFSNVVLILVLVLWAPYARQIRAEVLSLRERDFVALAKIAGASDVRIIVRHILPNVANTIIVVATLQVGWVVLIEAALSFLGVGLPPPQPAWGLMVAEGRSVLQSAWWISVAPGSAVFLTVLSFNLLGDWMRDRFDPRLRALS